MTRHLKCTAVNIRIIYHTSLSFNLDSCSIKLYTIDNFPSVPASGLIRELSDSVYTAHCDTYLQLDSLHTIHGMNKTIADANQSQIYNMSVRNFLSFQRKKNCDVETANENLRTHLNKNLSYYV